ncbi:MAG: T9SS type A sorting domain-containing protein [Saprospiraceae bacterium]|nr:T9SS type A sorting domain-containing protein [Saprospiraceae bacterium]
MKHLLTLLLSLSLSPAFSQTYNINVPQDYASASQAQAGDTVYIWAKEWGISRIFSHWTGDTSMLESPLEWRTRFIMPAHDVNLQSVTTNMPTGGVYPLVQENIMGRDRLKRVFSYFPSNNAPAGVCWFWHGTGGSASTWAGQEYEQHQFVKYFISKGWGVIITESDESTTNTDLNGDGALRYDYVVDSVASVDIANVRAIRDTFIHRGKMTWNTPQAAAGFSAGGAFSLIMAGLMQWHSALSNCNPGGPLVAENTLTPSKISMNLFDNHPDVGPMGNLDGYFNYQTLLNRGVCTDFEMLRPSPVYPQRFQRLPGISATVSNSIYNELIANGCINAIGFPVKNSNEITAAVIMNPANWPVALSLTGGQRQFILDQVDVMIAAHHFHSDFMAADFAFISDPCGTAVGIKDLRQEPAIRVLPNPVSDRLFLPENISELSVIDVYGRVVFSGRVVETLDVSMLKPGTYFIKTNIGNTRFVKI